ncbi:TerD family protein [Cohnella soli]|uniref:TerD family protein n=1 Tax=Cohnella soli TaxID=425005 RepID=A0ABW0HX84_9BACL
MSMLIVKGQKTDVTKGNPSLQRIVVGMGWQADAGLDLDLSVFLLRGNGKVGSDHDLVFYSNPAGGAGSVSLTEAERKSYGGQADREQVNIRLDAVPQEVERISFSLTIYEGDQRKQNFSLAKDAYIRIVDEATGSEIVRYTLGNSFNVETAIVVGDLYRHSGEWKFNAVGAGYSGGLASLCASFGIDVKEEARSSEQSSRQSAAGQAAPVAEPPPKPVPSAPPAATPPSSIRLDKIELRKKGDVINLQKNTDTGTLGEILVNLNWNQRKSGGLFKSSKGVDLDLGCLYELKDGSKGVVQALGNSFGNLQRVPFVALDGDDRTGAVAGGENLRINGAQVARIKRIVVFAFIYEGIADWSEADGVVTVKQTGGPDIIVRMDEYNNRKGMCAIAMIQNVNDQTFSVERLVQFFSGHQELDKAYDWNMRWVKGSK